MKSIKYGLGLIAAWALFSATSTSAWAQEWKELKNPQEIRALLSNKTLSGLGADGRQAVSYFRSDGVGLKIVEGERIPRAWKVRDDGLYCVESPRVSWRPVGLSQADRTKVRCQSRN